MKIPGWLKALGAVIAAVAAALVLLFVGQRVYREVQALVGNVYGKSDPFVPDPRDPGRLLVEVKGEMVSVPLPAGIRADRVRAVAATESGKVTVEVLP